MAPVSPRKLALLIFGPMCVESIGSLLTFWMLLNATRAHYEPRSQMLIAALGSLGYGSSSYLAGRWVTPARAPYVMMLSIALATLCGLAGLYAGTFAFSLVANTLLATCIGHYYVPFQINMSHVHPFRTLAWTVAFYNVAWATGTAMGTFVGGWFRESSFALLASVVLITLAIHTVLNLSALRVPDSPDDRDPASLFRSTASQRRVGWLCFFAVAITLRPIYTTLWQALAQHRGWSDHQIAVGSLMLYSFVPVGSLLLARLRRFLHHPHILLGSLLLGAVGMIALPLTHSFPVALLCLACLGIMETCAVFHAIYYSNADPTNRAHSIGTFEGVVGLGYALGVVLLGLTAWDDATALRTYLLATAILLAAALAASRLGSTAPSAPSPLGRGPG
jgi:hypothetical protein